MKLVRYGERGEEKPGTIDENGALRDLAGVVADIADEVLCDLGARKAPDLSTLRFIAPVFIGDTIYTIRENLSKESMNDTMGKVRVSYSVYKGAGDLVLYCERLMTALYRNPEAANA